MLSDPEFERPFYSLTHSTAVQAVGEAMKLLHSTPVSKVEWAVCISVMMSDSAFTFNTLTQRDAESMHVHSIQVWIMQCDWAGSYVYLEQQILTNENLLY